MTDNARYTQTRTFHGSVAKLAASLAIVLAACSLSWEDWPATGALLALALAGLAVSGMPLAELARRLALFSPVVALLALSIPLSQGFSSGWSLAATVASRATVSFLAGLWLIHVLPFDEMLLTLKRLRIPDVCISTLSFMHRNIFVLWEETRRIRTARKARRFGRTDRLDEWRAAIGLIATLVIRSLDRGDRIHRAMLARGWDGHFRHWQKVPASDPGPVEPS
ncbi:MAG: cobalt ECF transporter T component CbiQ [Planctomycetaceae bacterium]|nr:cobalt ECF transporter T component CbiQ [Planctomycetaceae bacterium]